MIKWNILTEKYGDYKVIEGGECIKPIKASDLKALAVSNEDIRELQRRLNA